MVQGRVGWSSGAPGSLSPAWRTKAAQQPTDWERRPKRARPVEAPVPTPAPAAGTAEHPVLQVPRAPVGAGAPPRRRWAPSPLRRAMASARVRRRHDPPAPDPAPAVPAAHAAAAGTTEPTVGAEAPPPPLPAWATRDARRAARGAPRRRFCD
jgi:hypothetical protein